MLANRWGRMIQEYVMCQPSISILAPYSRSTFNSKRPLFYIPVSREVIERAIQVDQVDKSWTAANACRILLLASKLISFERTVLMLFQGNIPDCVTFLLDRHSWELATLVSFAHQLCDHQQDSVTSILTKASLDISV